MHANKNLLETEVESLESRFLLAGNVEAVVRGGTLFIEGDDLGNRITILGNGTTVNIEGDGTTVNGLETQDFTGVTKNIDIRMRGGHDFLAMDDLNLNGFLSVDTGSGRAWIRLRDSTVQGDVRFKTGIVGNGDGVGIGVEQRIGNSVINGRIKIDNADVDAADAHWGIFTAIGSNVVERGIHVRQSDVEVTNAESHPCCVTAATTTWISNNSVLSGGVRITSGKGAVNQPSQNTLGHGISMFDNARVSGGVAVRLGSTEINNGSDGASAVRGSGVAVFDNLLIDGNINVRVGNATVAGNVTDRLQGNRTAVSGNREITGNVSVRQGSVTAVAGANTAIGNEFALSDNSISGRVNVFNGDADVVSDVMGFAFALGVHNEIEGNEADRIRITNRTGSSSSPGISGGILTEFTDNLVSRDVLIADGNATGDTADATLNMRDSSIGGRFNYIGRNGSNTVSLASMDFAGPVLARTGNGDDLFELFDSTFESNVRLVGAGGDADEFGDFGGNTFELSDPILVNIEIE